MTQEQLRMQMLAGILTEGQYKAMLNEEAEYNPSFLGKEDPKLKSIVDIMDRYNNADPIEDFETFANEIKRVLNVNITFANDNSSFIVGAVSSVGVNIVNGAMDPQVVNFYEKNNRWRVKGGPNNMWVLGI
jgi:hypothetical protein